MGEQQIDRGSGEQMGERSDERSPSREWWTYADLARHLGSTPDAMRVKAKRAGWEVRQGNRPGAPVQVRVPFAVLSDGLGPKRRSNVRPIIAGRSDERSAEQSGEIKRLSAELAAVKERLSGVEAERSAAVQALASATAALAAAETGARAERDRLLSEVERLSADLREARLPWLVRVLRALRA